MNYIFLGTLLVIIFLLKKLSTLEGRIKGLEYTLDQVTNEVELPEKPINDELRKLLKEGEDVKAVKGVREALGLSLVEAKKYVDALK